MRLGIVFRFSVLLGRLLELMVFKRNFRNSSSFSYRRLSYDQFGFQGYLTGRMFGFGLNFVEQKAYCLLSDFEGRMSYCCQVGFDYCCMKFVSETYQPYIAG